MKPLLAHIYEPHRLTQPFFIQPKFNGVRALYQMGHFQSREEIPWNPAVLAHLTGPLQAMFPDDRIILDGELYHHGWPLQRINGAVATNRSAPSEDTAEIIYVVFDVVNIHQPFDDRFTPVSKVITELNHPAIAAATTVKPPDLTHVEDFYAAVVSDGFEGIMYRLGDCPYTKPKQERPIACITPHNAHGFKRVHFSSKFLSDKNNRVWHMLKRKDWQDAEFTCVEIQEGEGKRAGMVGSFICALPNGKMFNVGSGLSDTEAIHYFYNPDEVRGHQIKVKFLTYTSDGKPFNPTIEAIL